MALSSTITFRNMRKIAALEVDIQERIAKLVRFAPTMTATDVVVQPVGRHHRAGRRHRVRITIAVPGDTIVVAHAPEGRRVLRVREANVVRKQDEPDQEHRDVGLAVRDAFAAAKRQVQDYVRRQRGSVKSHTSAGKPTRRRVVR